MRALTLHAPALRFAAAAALLVALAPLARPAAAQAERVSLEALTRSSSSVVVGSVAAKESRWNADRTRIYTEVRLRVTDRVKGDAGAETVVLVPGGRVGTTLYEVSDMPAFVEGEEVVAFLWRDPEGRNLVTGAASGLLHVQTAPDGTRLLDVGAADLLEAGLEDLPAGADVASRPVAAAAVEALDGAPDRRVALDAFLRAVRAAQTSEGAVDR